MKKRIRQALGGLLAVCMLLALLPMQTLAYVGSLQQGTNVETGVRDYPSGNLLEISKIYSLKNDYIQLELVQTPRAVFSVVQPTRTAGDAVAALFQGSYSHDRFTIQYRGKAQTELQVSSIHIGVDDNKSITVYYRFTDPWVYYNITYTLVQLNEGYQDGHSNSGIEDGERVYSTPDDNDADQGRAWGIHAELDCGYTLDTVPMYQTAYFRWYNDQYGFSHGGHSGAAKGGSVKISKTGVSQERSDGAYTYNTSRVSVSAGLDKAKTCVSRDEKHTDYITEIYTDGFLWAKPFVATGENFYSGSYARGLGLDWSCGTEGFSRERMPEYVTYDARTDVVTTQNYIYLCKGEEKYTKLPTLLWGYRDLYRAEESEFTPSDDVQIAEDATQLGIYKSDKFASGYVAYPIPDEAAGKQLSALYGEPVASLRGNFRKEDTDKYAFQNGKVGLTSTATASWGENGYFRVGEDGTIDSAQIHLNTPKFKFYAPKDNSLKLNFGADGLVAEMDPKKNGAIIDLDIPNATCQIDRAELKNSGDVLFSGAMSLNLLFGADNPLEVEKLSYGMKGESFRCNGVKASAKIDTADVLGMELGKIEGEINTFRDKENGPEYYHFELELNAFDLFETEAELTLKRLNSTGDLMPDDLFFALSVEPGIQLVPPFIAGRLTGGGGGFYDLADTCNGDFFAIPPIKLRVQAKGSYLNILDGKADMTAGPGYFQWKLSDIELMKIGHLVDEFQWYVGLTGEERSYKNKSYTGLRLSGGSSISLSVPEKYEVIKAGGGFNLNAYGGLDNWKNPSSVYLLLDGNGKIYGEVRIPKNIRVIGGVKLASMTLDFALGGQTAVAVRGVDFQGAVKSAFRNFSVYGGAAVSGSVAGVKYRVYYIIPKKVGVDIALWWDDLEDWVWEEHLAGQDAAVLVECSLLDLPTEVTPQPEVGGAYSKTVSLGSGETAPAGEDVLLLLTPKSGTAEELAKSLSITTASGAAVELTPASYDESGALSNPETAKLLIGKDGDQVLVNLGKGAAKSWTVQAAQDFTASLNCSKALPALEAQQTGSGVQASVANPEDGAAYTLRTYYGAEPGGTDHLVAETDLSGTSITQQLPTQGAMMPSGSYYVTTLLMQKITGDFDEDGKTTESETALLTVDSKQLQTVSYTNTFQPAAAKNVKLETRGNEVMRASWDAVEDADGYTVTIYRKDGEEWVNAGIGYQYDAAEFTKKTGLFSKDGTLGLDMALTVGGADADGNSTALSADQTYKVGVTAYRYQQDSAGNVTTGQVMGKETQSNEKFLPAYQPLALQVQFNGTELTPDADSGLYHAVSGQDGCGEFQLSATGAEHIRYQIHRMDTGVALQEAAWGAGSFVFEDAAAEGALQFRLRAVNEDTGDVTTKYLVLERDDTQPLLTLDETLIHAGEDTGAYTITGRAEPGSTVWVSGTQLQTVADANGRFQLSGTLEEETEYDEEKEESVRIGFVPLYAELTATDAAGNSSDPATALVVARKTPTILEKPEPSLRQDGEYTIQFDGNGGISTAETMQTTDGKLAQLPQAERSGYRFTGWFTEKTGGTEITKETVFRENTTVYAQWQKTGGGSGGTVIRPTEPFTDVRQSDWFFKEVMYVYNKGIMLGTGGSLFRPDDTTTRGMMATILWRLEKSPAPGGKDRFSDVASDAWYADAIAWGTQQKLYSGYGNGKFGPDDPITREQLAAIFYRYAAYKGEKTTENAATLDAFRDAKQISDWAKPVMGWAVEKGLLQGKENGTLDPQGTATRAEIAATLYRFLEKQTLL